MTKTTDTTRTIESDPTEPFRGLCKFVEWWTAFQRDHCQGVEATWSVNADLVVTFRFVYTVSVRKYSLDLKDRYIPKALDEIEIVLLDLREAKTSCL